MHYTVMVVGENPEEQMIPFDENREDILKLEEKLYKERYAKYGDAASKEPVYMKRLDLLAQRFAEWEKDVAEGKTKDPTFEAYVYEYYFGEIEFVPKSVFLARPEIKAGTRVKNWMDLTPEERSADAKPLEPYWYLNFSNRFAVFNEADGQIEGIYYYTVPNPKWDWYVLGGRWHNFFKVKPERVTHVAYNFPSNGEARREREDLKRRYPSTHKNEDPRDNYTDHADQLRIEDIDFEGHKALALQEGGKYYDGFHAIVAGRPFYSWDEWLAKAGFDKDKAREMREADPVDSAIRKSDYLWLDIDDLGRMKWDREKYLDFWVQRSMATYSLLMDGVWQDRETWTEGNWRHNEYGTRVTDPNWYQKINELLETLPKDTLITIYDYHT